MSLLSTLLAVGASLVSATPNFLLSRQSSTVTVNIGTTYQTMDGFGCSQAFGTAYSISNLASGPQKQVLDYLFSTTTGAGLTILRNRIGSGGAGDSIEPNSPGAPGNTPTYAAIGTDSEQLWVSQQAKAYGVSTFYADAWSAPGFMKTNGEEINGGYLCGVDGESCSSGSWLQAYANFLVQYIKDYAANGIQITNVGFLNEPDFTASYSSMLSSGTQAADFIKVLHSTLASNGLSSVGINCCDATGWNVQKTMTADLISAGVENLISRITSHSYSSNPTSPISTTSRVWETEFCDLTGPFTTTWYANGNGALTEGMTWANLIYTGIVDANLSAYLFWYGATTNGAGGALINIDGSTVEPSSKLWALAQWSRFVRPGAVRIGTSGSTSNVLTSAFKNPDGTVSVQLLNNAGSSSSINVQTVGGFTASALAAYITNNNNLGVNSYSASLSGGTISVSIPAYSFITLVLTGGGSSGGGSTTKTMPPNTTPPATTTSSSGSGGGGTQSHWGQCGGSYYSGPTSCQSPYTCSTSNPYYAQCL